MAPTSKTQLLRTVHRASASVAPRATSGLVRGVRQATAFRDTLLSVRARKWAETAAEDLVTTGDHRATVLRLASLGAQAERALRQWESGGEEGRFAARVLLACSAADDGSLRCRDAPSLRPNLDVSVQARVLRALLDRLSEVASPSVTPRDIAEVLVRHRPDDRRALLVHAELLLDGGDLVPALHQVRRALRIQAVCPAAEALLFGIYRAMRAGGSDAPELDAVDYDLTDTFCPVPFTHLSTGWKGDAFVCCCPAWVPYPVGNVYEADSGDGLWNSPAAVEIRRSILDRDYRYCSRTQCAYFLSRKLPKRTEIEDPVLRGYIDNGTTVLAEAPRVVEVNHDSTCNLACPSCRTEIITAKRDEQARLADASERVILPLLRRVAGYAYISGGGDPFSSPHYRDLLSRLNRAEFPELTVYLVTNGLLLTRSRWEALPNLPEMIKVLSVSVDAARAETYERLRRPGKWSTLMTNLRYLGELRRAGAFPAFQLNFVVQRDNFREMLELVELADDLGVDTLWFQRLVNYGTYDEATFAELDVGSVLHPEHDELLDILRNPSLQKESVNLNLLRDLLPEFVASDVPLPIVY